MDKLKRLCDRIQDLLERLLDFGDRLHQQARESQDDEFGAAQYRKDAELVNEARKTIWEQSHGGIPLITATGRANVANASFQEGNIKLIPWLMFTSILAGISVATSIILMILFAQVKSDQARMAVHIMSNDALMLREGIMQPGDQWAGPEGNLEYGFKDKPNRHVPK